MLTRHLSQSHTFRTVRLVLPQLQCFYTSSLFQLNSRGNTEVPRLTLNWESGNEDFDYRCDDYGVNVPILRDIRHRKIKVEINPTLGWTPRQLRRIGSGIIYKFSRIIDKNPKLRWLPATRSVLEPQLDWPSELSSGLGVLLEKGKGLVVKRLKSQAGGPRSPGDGLVRRYTIEKEQEIRPRFVRRVRGRSWDLTKEWVNLEVGTAKLQQAELSEEERLEWETFECERKSIREERETLADKQEKLVIKRNKTKRDRAKQDRAKRRKQNKKSLIRRVQSRLKAIGTTESKQQALKDRQKQPIIRKVQSGPEALGTTESEQQALKDGQKQPIIRKVQSGPEALGATESEQQALKDGQKQPIIRKVQRGPEALGATENEQQALKNGQKQPRKVQSAQGGRGLIKPILHGPQEPSATGEKATLAKSNTHAHTEFRVRDVSFELQRTMGDQPTVSTSAEERVREEVSNAASMGVLKSSGEAVPNDTNLAVKENGGEAISHESDTTVAPSKSHDLKRTNISSESSLRSFQKAKFKPWKKRKLPERAMDCSLEAVLNYDIKHFLSSLDILQEEDKSSSELPGVGSEIGLTISELSSTGDGLAVHNNRVYVVPFCVPGDKVNATIRRHNPNHSVAKVTSVTMPSSNRDDSLVRCKYFGTCTGCQLQMLPYALQLEHKRKVVQNAFKNFSNLPPKLLPEVGETMASPLQYGYRTKLTPHFNGPRKGGFKLDMPVPKIGFMAKDPLFVLDIEDCPIGTDAVRRGMKERRKFVAENFVTAFKRGATLLLRESTMRTYLGDSAKTEVEGQLEGYGRGFTEEKVCVTDHKAKSIEYVGDLKFESPAGSFFQNNNSILPEFTSYIRENLNLPVTKKTEGEVIETAERPKYLVDAYCGTGLFSVTCGQGLERVWGIDVDKPSVVSARNNALENNIQNASFMSSPAEDIFGKLEFQGSETSLIIDPPKKGCDKRFLDQLLDFAPKRIVYVSCNVHSQARDVGYVLTDERGKGYKIDSIRGCDFFPQTHHVESIVVMTKTDG